MGGGSKSPSSTTQTTKPFPAQEQALTRLFERAEDRFQEGPQQFFPGQLIADPSGNVTSAEAAALGQVGNINQFGQLQQQKLQGLLDPTSEANQAAINPFIQQLQEQIVPSIGSNAIQQGAFGGDRQRIQEQLAAREVAGAATDTILRNQMNALQLAPQVAQQQLLGAEIQGNVGEAETARQQALIDAQRARFDFEQESPEIALDRLASRISGNSLGSISQTRAATGSGNNTGQVVGGAALLGSLFAR